ncbi:MAG: TonB C-terminal domain-containing protein [Gammaproteobacteria bacterium]
MARDRGLKRHLPVAGGLAMIGVVGYGLWTFVQNSGGVQAPVVPEVQQISIVVPPPPPPPPPPLEEPPPEPEVQEVDVPEPEPEPMDDVAEADEAPPGEELGLDAEGVAGADGFGLKAKKGGRGLLGGDPHKWYAGLVQRDLQSALSNIDAIRQGRYTIVLEIWVAPDGTIENSELVRGSGDAGIDSALTAALDGGMRMSKSPPDDLPQPIRLRISSRS